ncbi:MAG: peptide chain release factor N(5)-glutamine methyltransferase, partial [Acidobacteriota bacterium]|nr:peptide chain release factor N(5)-glutamine methyltransferase [Acidobacteriota bacterium]
SEPTVQAALRHGAERLAAAGVASPEFDAGLLLRAVARWSAAELIARAGDRLAPAMRDSFDALIAERATRRPLQHLVGTVEFFGLTLAVGPQALIPRPETETLVETALARFPETSPVPPRIADVGCGSGAIALALASRLPAACVIAIDNAPGALGLAAANIRRCNLGSRVRLVRGDLLAHFDAGTLDGVVANLPYIPDAEIDRLEPEVRDHEPRDALAGGPDGLDPLRRLAPMAARAVLPGGRVLVEIGAGQRGAAAGILMEAGFDPVESIPDLQSIPRVLAASLPAQADRPREADRIEP